jgi:RHS repeat-associated protein
MMPAAKHFDPVLGVDVHIIQPPGPVPPVPVPHPFVGFLIDPFDYVPILGGTIMVNGMMRAIAGTMGKNVPAHIPIGGMFVKPPANECEMFMGSATVAFDGDAASYLSLPALSCQCIGSIAPPRLNPKKKGKIKSLVLPTSVVLPIPAGPPVLIGGPPTISLMALGMKVVMAGLGKALKKLRALQKASKRWQAISQRMRAAANKLLDKIPGGQRMRNAVSKGICALTGHPVDVATGKVLTDAVDFELPGPLPLRFERIWYSVSTYEGPLGHGWHHSLDLGLTVYPEGLVARLADGRYAPFAAPGPDAPSWNPREKHWLHATPTGYALEDLAGLKWHFEPRFGIPDEYALQRIEDPNGNRIELARQGDRLVAITDSAGRRLDVVSDAAGRMLEIRGPDPDRPDATFPLVTYRYDRAGDLVEVADPLGNPFRYAYRGHLLVQETDRSGLSFYFAYDGDGPDARCVKTWGDGNILLRVLRYDDAQQRTVVADSFGYETVYEWNDLGLVTRETDPLGGVTETEWSPDADRISVTNPNGERTEFTYDEWGRMLSVTDASGAMVAFGYDEAGNVVSLTDPGENTWVREYDARRNVVGVTDPLGARRTFEVDSRGLPTRDTDPLGRTARLRYDRAGLLAAFRDRTGAETRYAYDALGRQIELFDALGGTERFAYDRRGLMTSHTDAAGRRWGRRYDASGSAVELIDPLGRVAAFGYGPMGRLVSVRSPAGRLTRYHYDPEGRLVRVVDPGEREWRLTRDAAGRIVEERTADGRNLRFVYDPAGRVIEFRNARGQRIGYRHDAAGRLLARVLPDGSEEAFRYDARGIPIEARNAAAELRWDYDACGRVLAESINGRTVTSRYDASGNRVARTSPLGRTIRFEYDPEGRILAVADGDAEVFRSSLDPFGRERRRVAPDGSTWEWDYLGSGEMTAVRVRGPVAFERRYAYDAAGNMTTQADSVFGAAEYGHDPDGLLTSVRFDDGARRSYAYDPAGNRVNAAGPEIRRDAGGNVVEKVGPRGRWRLEYDPLDRLSRMGDDRETEVTFTYDPLGRRIRKATRTAGADYLWDGDRVLGTADAEAAEYVYRAGTFEPVARLASGGASVIECDPVGLPRSAVASDGESSWLAAFEPFGETRAERGRSGLVPIRFPGQYADAETGLFYNRFRYYDPERGAYMSPDPLGIVGGGVWDYVPSPLSWIDPYGLAPKDPLHFGDGWRGRVDVFTTPYGTDYEVHVYRPNGSEAGVHGSQGWIPKHGHPASAPSDLPEAVANRIRSTSIQEARRAGHLPPKGRANIKGERWRELVEQHIEEAMNPKPKVCK